MVLLYWGKVSQAPPYSKLKRNIIIRGNHPLRLQQFPTGYSYNVILIKGLHTISLTTTHVFSIDFNATGTEMFHFPAVQTIYLSCLQKWKNKLYWLFKAQLKFSILVSSKNKFLGIHQRLCLMLDQVYKPAIADMTGEWIWTTDLQVMSMAS